MLLSSGVEERFGIYERSNTLLVVPFLDPRYKNCVFSSDQIKEDVKIKLIVLVANKIEELSSLSTAVQSSDLQEQANEIGAEDDDDDLDVFGYVKHCVAKHKPKGTKQSRAIIEVNRYLDEEILPMKNDPIEWWFQNKADYPFLSKVVRVNFCVLCTSVPCERVFSKAGNLLSERRNTFSGKKAQQLMFLNHSEK